MSRDRSNSVSPGAGELAWAGLLGEHREAWTATILRDHEVVDLADAEDPVAAVTAAADETAFVCLDGYRDGERADRLQQALSEAAKRNAPIVVALAVAADARREAQELLATFDDAQIVEQQLAAGSLIEPASDVRIGPAPVHLLVCANLPADERVLQDAQLAAAAEPLMSRYVAWLEQANATLRAANVRLGRERLGAHDAAAAATASKVTDLRVRIAALEEQVEQEREGAEINHRAYVDARTQLETVLQAPRYRFVDSVRRRALSLPVLSWIVRLRSRRIGSRAER